MLDEVRSPNFLDDWRFERCRNYMDKLSEHFDQPYSLAVTHRNEQLLAALWDAVTEEREPAQLRELATAVFWASITFTQQGCRHREPGSLDEMEKYRRLFNHVNEGLFVEDVKWSPPVRTFLEIGYTIESDDQQVLKERPGVQLALFDTDYETNRVQEIVCDRQELQGTSGSAEGSGRVQDQAA